MTGSLTRRDPAKDPLTFERCLTSSWIHQGTARSPCRRIAPSCFGRIRSTRRAAGPDMPGASASRQRQAPPRQGGSAVELDDERARTVTVLLLDASSSEAG